MIRGDGRFCGVTEFDVTVPKTLLYLYFVARPEPQQNSTIWNILVAKILQNTVYIVLFTPVVQRLIEIFYCSGLFVKLK